MNVDELEARLAQLKTIKPLPAARAFVERVPARERGRTTFHFFRPFAEDVVHFASVRNAGEDAAIELAVAVLDTLGARWAEVADREVARLVPWTAGPPFADALLVLGRGVAKKSAPGGHFLPSRTVAGYPIHHIEFTGDETGAEATVRMKDASLNDVTRTPSPIVFCRYKLDSGGGSAKHFAVAPASTVVAVLRDVVREGGRLEFENFEREACVFTTKRQTERIEVRVGKQERTMSHEEAVALFHQMTTSGVAAVLAGMS